MATFTIYKDELYRTWYRDYFEVEAETLEEAIQKIKSGEEDPYDTEPIPEIDEGPIRVEYMYNGDIVAYEED